MKKPTNLFLLAVAAMTVFNSPVKAAAASPQQAVSVLTDFQVTIDYEDSLTMIVGPGPVCVQQDHIILTHNSLEKTAVCKAFPDKQIPQRLIFKQKITLAEAVVTELLFSSDWLSSFLTLPNQIFDPRTSQTADDYPITFTVTTPVSRTSMIGTRFHPSVQPEIASLLRSIDILFEKTGTQP